MRRDILTHAQACAFLVQKIIGLYESDVPPSQFISTYFLRWCRCFVTFSTQHRLTSKKKFLFLFQSASNFLAHGKHLLLGSISFIDCLNQIPACMGWIIWFQNAGPFTMVIRGPIENIYQFFHSHGSGGLSCKISTTTSFSANVYVLQGLLLCCLSCNLDWTSQRYTLTLPKWCEVRVLIVWRPPLPSRSSLRLMEFVGFRSS